MAPIYSCKLKLGSNLQNKVTTWSLVNEKNFKASIGMSNPTITLFFPLGKNTKMGLN